MLKIAISDAAFAAIAQSRLIATARRSARRPSYRLDKRRASHPLPLQRH